MPFSPTEGSVFNRGCLRRFVSNVWMDGRRRKNAGFVLPLRDRPEKKRGGKDAPVRPPPPNPCSST